METFARPSKTLKKCFVCSEPDRIRIGDWGVVPIGKSISVSVAVRACACVRAKLCAGVRQMFLLGLGPPSRSLWGSVPPGPGRALPGDRAVSRVEKKSFVFSESDRIRTLSYSRGVFLPSFCAPKLLSFFS